MSFTSNTRDGRTAPSLIAIGVALALYPLTAFRAANKAAATAYGTLRRDGTQQGIVGAMQTRVELYESIGYHAFEQRLDALFASNATTAKAR